MYVESCTILVVCWLNWYPLWYSIDYRVYMGSSMTVRPLAGCYCTCALINWMVLLQFMCDLGSHGRRRGCDEIIDLWGFGKLASRDHPPRWFAHHLLERELLLLHSLGLLGWWTWYRFHGCFGFPPHSCDPIGTECACWPSSCYFQCPRHLWISSWSYKQEQVRDKRGVKD